MFWLRNKKNNFQLGSLIWGVLCTGRYFTSTLLGSKVFIKLPSEKITIFIPVNGLLAFNSINVYTIFTNFSMKYYLMCKVYTDVGGIK